MTLPRLAPLMTGACAIALAGCDAGTTTSTGSAVTTSSSSSGKAQTTPAGTANPTPSAAQVAYTATNVCDLLPFADAQLMNPRINSPGFASTYPSGGAMCLYANTSATDQNGDGVSLLFLPQPTPQAASANWSSPLFATPGNGYSCDKPLPGVGDRAASGVTAQAGVPVHSVNGCVQKGRFFVVVVSADSVSQNFTPQDTSVVGEVLRRIATRL